MSFKRESLSFVPMPGSVHPPDETGWKLWWPRFVEQARPSLKPLFATYMTSYRNTEERSRKFRQWARDFESQTTEERLSAGYDPFDELTSIDASRGTLKALSLALMVAFDNLLTSLRIRLRGDDKPYCTDDGPELRHGVTVDRALDAAGNYLRHEHEWRIHDYRATVPGGRQLTSIMAIARLSTTLPIAEGDAEEAYMQYTTTMPGPMILDLLCDYEADGDESSYETVQLKVKDAGFRTIDVTFDCARSKVGTTK